MLLTIQFRKVVLSYFDGIQLKNLFKFLISYNFSLFNNLLTQFSFIKQDLKSLFQDRDKVQNGKISYEQLEDIFRIYQVMVEFKLWLLLIQLLLLNNIMKFYL